jgi:magnesium transporter
MERSRIYRDGLLVETNFNSNDISELILEPNTAIWYDLVSPSQGELEHLGNELGLHELAVADAYKGRQRPKLDHYDSHLFINAYQARFDSVTAEISTSEIAIFVTDRALITVRSDESFEIDQVLNRWDDSKDLARNGVAFLLWGLLDVIVDGYFEAVEALDEEIEKLEDILFADKRNELLIQRRSYDLRKALVVLRRHSNPMREVLNPIIKRDAQAVGGTMFAYFQDIYDHTIRVSDWTDSLRDLVTTLLETNLTIQGNRMNLIMKKVTSWAAIIAVPTAITGFYGQNVPYPGFAAEWGFWFSTGSIVLISTGLYWTFRRNDWL